MTPLPPTHPGKGPEPWLFRGYQVVTVILNTLVWLLLIVCVGLLAIMLAWWAVMAALNASISAGIADADLILGPAGLSLRAASELSARLTGAITSSDPTLTALFGGAALPFAPVCAPVCINAGSLAPVLKMASSCVCGAEVIDAARTQSARGATAAVVGLAGAAAMWLASCLLLVILAGHAVTAGFDQRSAAWLKEQRSEQAVMGFVASQKDCVAAAPSDLWSADNEATLPVSTGVRSVSNQNQQRRAGML